MDEYKPWQPAPDDDAHLNIDGVFRADRPMQDVWNKPPSAAVRSPAARAAVNRNTAAVQSAAVKRDTAAVQSAAVEQDTAPTRAAAARRSVPVKKRKRRRRRRRRKSGFLIAPLILLGILLAVVAGCVVNIFYCRSNFEVNFYQVESVHVSSDIRIAVISDVHLSEFGQDNADLVQAVKELSPDLIISAGDLVTYGEDNYDNMLSLCRQLSAIAPMYGVMGNHEDEKVYLEFDEEMRQKFKDTGMKLLINKSETIKIRNNEIELVGVSGNKDGFDLYGGKDTMNKLEENNSALRILIAHVPMLFRDRLEDYDFDLGIAGHTHGGLIRIPMLGGLYSAEEGFLPDLDGGLFKLKNGATLFVSRGLGTSSAIPRFNNTPELAILDVRWY